MKRYAHTEADRAVWLVYVAQYTANELGMSITDTIELLAKNGFVEKALNGYPAFHTQGFEYMAEFLTGELRKARELDTKNELAKAKKKAKDPNTRWLREDEFWAGFEDTLMKDGIKCSRGASWQDPVSLNALEECKRIEANPTGYKRFKNAAAPIADCLEGNGAAISRKQCDRCGIACG